MAHESGIGVLVIERALNHQQSLGIPLHMSISQLGENNSSFLPVRLGGRGARGRIRLRLHNKTTRFSTQADTNARRRQVRKTRSEQWHATATAERATSLPRPAASLLAAVATRTLLAAAAEQSKQSVSTQTQQEIQRATRT